LTSESGVCSPEHLASVATVICRYHRHCVIVVTEYRRPQRIIGVIEPHMLDGERQLPAKCGDDQKALTEQACKLGAAVSRTAYAAHIDDYGVATGTATTT
jgi:hypothetical protein